MSAQGCNAYYIKSATTRRSYSGCRDLTVRYHCSLLGIVKILVHVNKRVAFYMEYIERITPLLHIKQPIMCECNM